MERPLPARVTHWLLSALLVVIATGNALAQSQDRISVIATGFEPRSITGSTAYERVGDASLPTWDVPGWESYDRLWREFAATPDQPALRKYLGLPVGSAAGEDTILKVARGRSAPRWLNWKPGAYRQIESPHFRIYSRAGEASGREVARDLERVYWIWTQVFFPLWDGNSQVALHLKNVVPGKPIADQIRTGTRLASRKKLRVILFEDAEDYQRTLSRFIPGVERSTGFYSDEQMTSFFYPTDSADSVATRRHELVHQLFREATRGSLGKRSPGMSSDFWLVEGVAGYFESLAIDAERTTVGGWDSPRLQFARYRMISNADRLPLAELFAEGRDQVQQRQDLTRWYAHAITRTHQFLDGDNVATRRWVYAKLAELYALRVEVPGAQAPIDDERSLVDFLRVDDNLLRALPPRRGLMELCLAGCEVTEDGLASLGTLEQLRWLDLSRLPIGNAAVQRLCPNPDKLDQLSLEATRIDDGIQSWLAGASRLQELDLSWTRCGDGSAEAIGSIQKLETLWMTGSAIGDEGIPSLLKLRGLESIDVQRTKITTQGVATLKREKPQWNVNPLQLRVAAPAK